jgi:hypothetical protein
MPLSKIQGIEGQVTPNLGRRNLIINGDMRIAQRATTVGSITSFNAYSTCDRFRFQVNDLGTWELSQSTESPEEEGFRNSYKLNCTSADTSVAAASYLIFQQRIEGQNVQHLKWGTSSAESLTFSFWIKSVKTGQVTVEFQHKNSGGTYYNRGATFTIDATNTWEKKIITVPGNTAQNIVNGASDGLYATLYLTAGSDYSSGTHNTSTWQTGNNTVRYSSAGVNFADSTNNEIYLTGWQLEVGSVSTEFEHRSLAEELASCERYYQKSYNMTNAPGHNGTAGAVFARNTTDGVNISNRMDAGTRFVTRMRSTPTVTIYSLNGTADNLSDITTGTNHSANQGVNSIQHRGTTGFGGLVVSGGNDEGLGYHYTAEAEI